MTALRAMASSPLTVTMRLPRFMPPTTTAPAYVLPERGPLPARLARALLRVVEPRVRKEDADHLFAVAVPEPEPPRARHARAAVGLEERRARHAAPRRLLGRGRAAMLADAEVEVPRADVHREVAVEHRERGLRGEPDLVGGALDDRAREDLGPVLAEELGQQPLDGVAPDGDLVVLGHATVRSVLHRARRHGAHGSADRRGRQRSSNTTGSRTRSARGRTSGGNGTRRSPRAASSAASSSRACAA